ncbi:hypothetical protein [Nocardioides panaciterrulae]|uniref:Lipoprotein n=1 Tax=Nocardioides panaciterrulae TaxID=661492 RepID=A0A7Y9EA62_9ACTN|nr:hypothetical protein [Nocardioides panaciterrulae]NYD43945.1 hypothetical protein [Nocardioides panaciterrulae]NYD44014.1 hypothetical protein [Nocardioides panaciterrulae]
MKKLGLPAVVVMALLLASCGGGGDGGPSAKDRQRAQDLCASAGQYLGRGMDLDRYQNPDGYRLCVKDAAKVADCLDTPAKSMGDAWVPENCDNDGYN